MQVPLIQVNAESPMLGLHATQLWCSGKYEHDAEPWHSYERRPYWPFTTPRSRPPPARG